MKQLLSTMLEWFNIFLGQVHVGINQFADRTTRHAIAHVRCINGGITQLNIIVDEPDRLDNPSRLVISDMFRQLTKMGFQPVNLEIINKERVTVYQLGRMRPLMVQSV